MTKLNLEPLEALKAAFYLLSEAFEAETNTEKRIAVAGARVAVTDAIIALGGADE